MSAVAFVFIMRLIKGWRFILVCHIYAFYLLLYFTYPCKLMSCSMVAVVQWFTHLPGVQKVPGSGPGGEVCPFGVESGKQYRVEICHIKNVVPSPVASRCE